MSDPRKTFLCLECGTRLNDKFRIHGVQSQCPVCIDRGLLKIFSTKITGREKTMDESLKNRIEAWGQAFCKKHGIDRNRVDFEILEEKYYIFHPEEAPI